MNLFHLIQKEKLSPELKACSFPRQDELKARSMDSLLDVGSEVFYPGIEEMPERTRKSNYGRTRSWHWIPTQS